MEEGCVFTGTYGQLRPYPGVLGMDERGYGNTTTPADPRNLRGRNAFAADLEEFFGLFRGRPVIAFGHSRGAWNWILPIAKRTGLTQFIPIVGRAEKKGLAG